MIRWRRLRTRQSLAVGTRPMVGSGRPGAADGEVTEKELIASGTHKCRNKRVGIWGRKERREVRGRQTGRQPGRQAGRDAGRQTVQGRKTRATHSSTALHDPAKRAKENQTHTQTKKTKTTSNPRQKKLCNKPTYKRTYKQYRRRHTCRSVVATPPLARRLAPSSCAARLSTSLLLQ